MVEMSEAVVMELEDEEMLEVVEELGYDGSMCRPEGWEILTESVICPVRFRKNHYHDGG